VQNLDFLRLQTLRLGRRAVRGRPKTLEDATLFDRCYLLTVIYAFMFYFFYLGIIPDTVLITFFASLGCSSFFFES